MLTNTSRLRFLAAACAMGLTVTVAAVLPSPVEARNIEQACMNSGRSSANRSLCGCIQRVADQTLTSSDQRTAARFFKDPQKAQDMRMSKSDRDNAFWERYQNFGYTAGKVCG